MMKRSFIANGQAYWISQEDPVTINLGADITPVAEMPQIERIARIRSSQEFQEKIGLEADAILKVCGKTINLKEVSDLDLYLWLQQFGKELLY